MKIRTHSSEISRDVWDARGVRVLCLQDEKVVFVAAWAGPDVEEVQMHAPFNLLLRLLMELSGGILLPTSPAAARALDDAKKPFHTGTGFIQDFSVQRHTSANTTVTVRIPNRIYIAPHQQYIIFVGCRDSELVRHIRINCTKPTARLNVGFN
jgi:hypothetical protein